MSSPTVLITGASSGIGRAAAQLFQSKGWQVTATMRKPDEETELSQLDGVLVTRLDVTDRASIDAAVTETLDRFGGLDVVVNNAGYGLAGPLEGASAEQIDRQLATNLAGPAHVMQAALPHFRSQGTGTFVNITSVGGRIAVPFCSVYNATKWGLEGLSEAAAIELRPLGVRVKIVEPGGVRTDFAGRSMAIASTPEADAAYGNMLQKAMAAFGDPQRLESYSDPEQIAEVIFTAATDDGPQLRYVAGEDAKQMLAARAEVDDATFIAKSLEYYGMT